MPTITGNTTGGLPILSYVLEWDQGNSSFVPLIGASPYSLITTFTQSGLVTGDMYKFRYAVINQVG